MDKKNYIEELLMDFRDARKRPGAYEHFVPPSDEILDTLEKFLKIMNWNYDDFPGIQIEDDDGTIVVMWFSDDKDNMYSFDILKDGGSVCTWTITAEKNRGKGEYMELPPNIDDAQKIRDFYEKYDGLDPNQKYSGF